MSLPVSLLEKRVEQLQAALETGAAQLQKMQANFNALQGALQEAQNMLATAQAATPQAVVPQAAEPAVAATPAAAVAAPQAVVPQAAVPSEEPAAEPAAN